MNIIIPIVDDLVESERKSLGDMVNAIRGDIDFDTATEQELSDRITVMKSEGFRSMVYKDGREEVADYYHDILNLLKIKSTISRVKNNTTERRLVWVENILALYINHSRAANKTLDQILDDSDKKEEEKYSETTKAFNRVLFKTDTEVKLDIDADNRAAIWMKRIDDVTSTADTKVIEDNIGYLRKLKADILQLINDSADIVLDLSVNKVDSNDKNVNDDLDLSKRKLEIFSLGEIRSVLNEDEDAYDGRFTDIVTELNRLESMLKTRLGRVSTYIDRAEAKKAKFVKYVEIKNKLMGELDGIKTRFKDYKNMIDNTEHLDRPNLIPLSSLGKLVDSTQLVVLEAFKSPNVGRLNLEEIKTLDKDVLRLLNADEDLRNADKEVYAETKDPNGNTITNVNCLANEAKAVAEKLEKAAESYNRRNVLLDIYNEMVTPSSDLAADNLRFKFADIYKYYVINLATPKADNTLYDTAYNELTAVPEVKEPSISNFLSLNEFIGTINGKITSLKGLKKSNPKRYGIMDDVKEKFADEGQSEEDAKVMKLNLDLAAIIGNINNLTAEVTSPGTQEKTIRFWNEKFEGDKAIISKYIDSKIDAIRTVNKTLKDASDEKKYVLGSFDDVKLLLDEIKAKEEVKLTEPTEDANALAFRKYLNDNIKNQNEALLLNLWLADNVDDKAKVQVESLLTGILAEHAAAVKYCLKLTQKIKQDESDFGKAKRTLEEESQKVFTVINNTIKSVSDLTANELLDLKKLVQVEKTIKNVVDEYNRHDNEIINVIDGICNKYANIKEFQRIKTNVTNVINELNICMNKITNREKFAKLLNNIKDNNGGEAIIGDNLTTYVNLNSTLSKLIGTGLQKELKLKFSYEINVLNGIKDELEGIIGKANLLLQAYSKTRVDLGSDSIANDQITVEGANRIESIINRAKLILYYDSTRVDKNNILSYGNDNSPQKLSLVGLEGDVDKLKSMGEGINKRLDTVRSFVKAHSDARNRINDALNTIVGGNDSSFMHELTARLTRAVHNTKERWLNESDVKNVTISNAELENLDKKDLSNINDLTNKLGRNIDDLNNRVPNITDIPFANDADLDVLVDANHPSEEVKSYWLSMKNIVNGLKSFATTLKEVLTGRAKAIGEAINEAEKNKRIKDSKLTSLDNLITAENNKINIMMSEFVRVNHIVWKPESFDTDTSEDNTSYIDDIVRTIKDPSQNVPINDLKVAYEKLLEDKTWGDLPKEFEDLNISGEAIIGNESRHPLNRELKIILSAEDIEDTVFRSKLSALNIALGQNRNKLNRIKSVIRRILEKITDGNNEPNPAQPDTATTNNLKAELNKAKELLGKVILHTNAEEKLDVEVIQDDKVLTWATTFVSPTEPTKKGVEVAKEAIKNEIDEIERFLADKEAIAKERWQKVKPELDNADEVKAYNEYKDTLSGLKKSLAILNGNESLLNADNFIKDNALELDSIITGLNPNYKETIKNNAESITQNVTSMGELKYYVNIFNEIKDKVKPYNDKVGQIKDKADKLFGSAKPTNLNEFLAEISEFSKALSDVNSNIVSVLQNEKNKAKLEKAEINVDEILHTTAEKPSPTDEHTPEPNHSNDSIEDNNTHTTETGETHIEGNGDAPKPVTPSEGSTGTVTPAKPEEGTTTVNPSTSGSSTPEGSKPVETGSAEGSTTVDPDPAQPGSGNSDTSSGKDHTEHGTEGHNGENHDEQPGTSTGETPNGASEGGSTDPKSGTTEGSGHSEEGTTGHESGSEINHEEKPNTDNQGSHNENHDNSEGNTHNGENVPGTSDPEHKHDETVTPPNHNGDTPSEDQPQPQPGVDGETSTGDNNPQPSEGTGQPGTTGDQGSHDGDSSTNGDTPSGQPEGNDGTDPVTPAEEVVVNDLITDKSEEEIKKLPNWVKVNTKADLNNAEYNDKKKFQASDVENVFYVADSTEPVSTSTEEPSPVVPTNDDSTIEGLDNTKSSADIIAMGGTEVPFEDLKKEENKDKLKFKGSDDHKYYVADRQTPTEPKLEINTNFTESDFNTYERYYPEVRVIKTNNKEDLKAYSGMKYYKANDAEDKYYALPTTNPEMKILPEVNSTEFSKADLEEFKELNTNLGINTYETFEDVRNNASNTKDYYKANNENIWYEVPKDTRVTHKRYRNPNSLANVTISNFTVDQFTDNVVLDKYAKSVKSAGDSRSEEEIKNSVEIVSGTNLLNKPQYALLFDENSGDVNTTKVLAAYDFNKDGNTDERDQYIVLKGGNA